MAFKDFMKRFPKEKILGTITDKLSEPVQEAEESKIDTGFGPRELKSLPESGPRPPKQRFLKNNQYFTISVYAVVVLILAAIIFKSIIDFEDTKASIGSLLSILSPFLLGALVAYVLNPLENVINKVIKRLTSRKSFTLRSSIQRIISITLTYLFVLGLLVLVIIFVIPEIVNSISDFVRYLPEAYEKFLAWLNSIQERFPQIDMSAISRTVADTMPNLMQQLQTFAAQLTPALYEASLSVASWIINLLLTIIVSIYMLYDKKRLMHIAKELLYAFLPKKYVPACQEILTECNNIFSSFVIGKFIDSLIIGILCFFLMTILNLDYVLLISIIVGITNMIPYFGPFIGAVPGALIMLFIKPSHCLIFLIMILALQQFDGLILGPKILGNSIGMKPLGIIFAITVGGSLAGEIGMFLGVPIVAIISYLFQLYLGHRLKKNHISDSMVDRVIKKMGVDK